jgi:hypothetical protein
MTLAEARTIDPNIHPIGYGFLDFCLSPPPGIRAATARASDVHKFARHKRHVRGRVAILLTANSHYSLDGIRPPMALTAAANRVHLARPFHVGRNTWYILTEQRHARGVLYVRHGVVLEVGVAMAALTRTRKAQLAFLNSI